MEKGQLLGKVKLLPSALGTAEHRSLMPGFNIGVSKVFVISWHREGAEVYIGPEVIDLYPEDPTLTLVLE